jgi:hypothetical protein
LNLVGIPTNKPIFPNEKKYGLICWGEAFITSPQQNGIVELKWWVVR